MDNFGTPSYNLGTPAKTGIISGERMIMDGITWNMGNKKGQGEFHPVPKPDRLRTPLPCFYAFHQCVPGGIRTRIDSLAGKYLIQLDGRGHLSLDCEPIIFDNILNYLKNGKGLIFKLNHVFNA